ncbi:MAG: hypothetical protein V4608_14725 [Bacteroidota bacterium]
MENTEFEKLIERLHACSLIKHPNRPWSDQGKINISISWEYRQDQLKERVEKLEKELNVSAL